MLIDILSLFPEMFKGVFTESMIGRAQKNRIVDIGVCNLRDFAEGKHKMVDDKPFGGGAGMIIKAEPVFKAVAHLLKKVKSRKLKTKVILTTPQGKIFNQETAKRLSREKHLILICGHYEGIDERISGIVDEEISIGEYVLTGGELPAMVLVDSIVRLIPGVVKEEQSIINDSFYEGLLDYPNYTRPRVFKNMKVPDVLLSGNHKEIASWRFKQMIKTTLRKLPGLLKKRKWTDEENAIIKEVKDELKKEAKKQNNH